MSAINEIENQLESLGNKVGNIEGQCEFLTKEIKDKNNLIEKYKSDLENHEKAVEILDLVQKVTQEKIKESFEKIVTYALNYIFQSNDYSFHLVFGRRGNLQELNFAVQTPTKTEPISPLDSDGGGVNNILSLALRLVLLEITRPKIDGFVIIDESFANLSQDYLETASNFINEINKRLKKQIIMISHQKEFIENPSYHKIELKKG